MKHPGGPFSHEAVARAAVAVGPLRGVAGARARPCGKEILPQLAKMYRAFEENEKLERAVMESPAGAQVRAQGAEEGRASFEKSLRGLTKGMAPAKRRQVRAVFQGIHSGPFWQMLRDRGGLSGKEAIAAASWAAGALIGALRHSRRHVREKREQ
jgi:hypothetical protein